MSSKDNKQTKTTSVRISDNVLEKLAQVAEKEDRTIRSVLDMAAIEWLERRAEQATD